MLRKKMFIGLFIIIISSPLFAQWNIEIIDNSPTSAKSSDIAYDNNEYPHIVYLNGDHLRYTYWAGSGWVPATTLKTGVITCKITKAPNDQMYVLYSTYSNDRRYYQQIGGSEIEFSNGGGDTYSLDFQIDTNNNVNIVYSCNNGVYYYDNDGLIHIDQMGGANADVAIALDSSDNPHVVYSTGISLKYAKRLNGLWMLNTIDDSGDMGLYCSIKIDDNDVIHVSYYDNDNGNLKYAMLEL